MGGAVFGELSSLSVLEDDDAELLSSSFHVSHVVPRIFEPFTFWVNFCGLAYSTSATAFAKHLEQMSYEHGAQ